MRHRHLPHPPVFFHGQDKAKIRDSRHDEVGQAAKRFLVIERTGQDVAGVRQKGEPFLPRLGFGARGLFAKEFLTLFGLPFYLLGFFEEIDKDRNLRSQNFRNDGGENVIDRADGVTARDVRVGVVHCADENDRRRLGARPLPDERGGFEAVHPRHVHVEQDHGEILLEQATERFLSRTGANQVLVEIGENCLVGQHLVGAIVDNQDADLFFGRLVCAGLHRHD